MSLPPLIDAELDLLRENRFIAALKAYKDRTNMKLSAAERAVDKARKNLDLEF